MIQNNDTKNAIRQERLLNSVRHACERLDLSRTTVYELINQGKLTAIKIGGKTLITEDSLVRVASGKAA